MSVVDGGTTTGAAGATPEMPEAVTLVRPGASERPQPTLAGCTLEAVSPLASVYEPG